MDDAEREQVDDPVAGPTLYIGLVGIVATVVSIVLVHFLFYGMEGRIEDDQVLSADFDEVTRLKRDQLEWLQGHRWIDRQGGVVGVPVEEVMGKLIEEHRKSP